MCDELSHHNHYYILFRDGQNIPRMIEVKKEIYDIFYKDKISYSTFEKIYEGYTWKGIHMDVYTELNKI